MLQKNYVWRPVCQHIQRWQVPRANYPEGRVGYLRWRTALYQFHSDKAAAILRQVGYEEDTIARVSQLLRKKGLYKEEDMRSFEDVICLVFFQYYLEGFSKKHSKEKIYKIIQKTWRKMSDKGQKASQELDLPADLRQLLKAALKS